MNNPIIDGEQGSLFEKLKRRDSLGAEYWSSRDLAKVLGYAEYRNFMPVIEKSQKACENSKQKIIDHFVDMHEMIDLGKGAQRSFAAVKLSRYACYLIVQNADPSKEIVALGQTYFAVQTRKQEITEQTNFKSLGEDEKRMFLRDELKEHNKKLADAAKSAGVIQPLDYAIFQEHGYKGLYGGLGSRDIHAKKNLKKSEKILDHMGSTELAANLFRATQTEEKLSRENVKGKHKANLTHYEVGQKVRQTIKDLGGTMPEDLPVADSIKKITNQKNKKLK